MERQWSACCKCWRRRSPAKRSKSPCCATTRIPAIAGYIVLQPALWTNQREACRLWSGIPMALWQCDTCVPLDRITPNLAGAHRKIRSRHLSSSIYVDRQNRGAGGPTKPEIEAVQPVASESRLSANDPPIPVHWDAVGCSHAHRAYRATASTKEFNAMLETRVGGGVKPRWISLD